MLKIRLKRTGAEPSKVAESLRGVGQRVRDYSPAMPRLLVLMSDGAVRRIREGRVDGPPLSKQTRAIRHRLGYGNKPDLVRSGELLDALRPLESGAASGAFGATLSWPVGVLHDGGTVRGRGGRVIHLPERRFLDPEPQTVKEGATVLDDHIRDRGRS